MTPTLVLPPRFSDDSNALWRAAIRLGWNIERLQNWRVPESFSPAPLQKVAIYGESLWANFVAQQLELRLYEPPLDWLAKLPAQFVGRSVEFGTLEQAREKSFPRFVKPAGEKAFEARVYQSAQELPPDSQGQEPLWVLTSDVVEWEVEHRFFVLGERIETASSYWRGEASTLGEDGEHHSLPGELEAASGFVESLLGDEQQGFAGAVVDVGLLSGFGWAVVEANPAFALGIYGCDPEKVLQVVAGCVMEKR